MILKGQRIFSSICGGFVFGEKIRHKKGLVEFQSMAQFDLFHHVHDEETLITWVSFDVETLVQHWNCEHTFVLKQSMRIEDFVHTIGNPLRVENTKRFEAWVILKVQDNAEVVQEADQRALTSLVADFIFGA